MSIMRIGNSTQLAGSKYILDERGMPQEEPDLPAWGKWFETADRRVDETTIGEARISTVFLGLDHGFGSAEPLLWETMVFGGVLNQEQVRYSTREDAEAGHQEMCDWVREAEGIVA